ncbi:MAG: SDR family NAD(P)-dependent oxidoreductase [Actinomycetaceae bacterium]|nr:SDR family NAD(P)-dependent oxidoreductase [Actinomycetaceae bacterium]MDY6082709.1 SDR family NAD(P)-dependent oxidoreductase [Actinomycetaceae bacterium]
MAVKIGKQRIDISGRALVTGGSSGLGKAFARALAGRGCSLTLVARNQQRLEQTRQEVMSEFPGVDVEVISADLGTDDGIRVVAQRLEDRTDPITVFVNNAGHGLHHKLATTDVDPLIRTIDVMVTAPVVLGAYAAAAMKDRGRGIIVNVASISGLVAMGLYSAVKSLMGTWSDSLAIELHGSGVHVMTLLPGWVRTDLHARAHITTSNIPDVLWLTPEQVVIPALNAIERGKHRFIPTARYKVIGALASYAPRSAVNAVTAAINRSRTRAQESAAQRETNVHSASRVSK